MPSAAEFQHTLAKAASLKRYFPPYRCQGIVEIQPAAANSGSNSNAKTCKTSRRSIATIANVKTVERATTIGEGSIRVHTVEHVLAALSGLGVDNAVIEMICERTADGDDGSALMDVEAIRKAGVVPLERPGSSFTPGSRSRLRQKEDRFVLLPDDEFLASPALR